MPLNERKANISVPEGELARQREYAEAVRSIIEAKYSEPPKAFVHTYGCQGNVADGERLKGMLADMGYELVEELEGADLVLYNTCAIREHAEDRVFGNVGALKGMKNANRDMRILLCGCMMQQEHVAEKIRNSYPFVDIVFGTHVIHRLPELLAGSTRSPGTGRLPSEFGTGAVDEDLAQELDARGDGTLSLDERHHELVGFRR